MNGQRYLDLHSLGIMEHSVQICLLLTADVKQKALDLLFSNVVLLWWIFIESFWDNNTNCLCRWQQFWVIEYVDDLLTRHTWLSEARTMQPAYLSMCWHCVNSGGYAAQPPPRTPPQGSLSDLPRGTSRLGDPSDLPSFWCNPLSTPGFVRYLELKYCFIIQRSCRATRCK